MSEVVWWGAGTGFIVELIVIWLASYKITLWWGRRQEDKHQ